jgi:hypothetical protein
MLNRLKPRRTEQKRAGWRRSLNRNATKMKALRSIALQENETQQEAIEVLAK